MVPTSRLCEGRACERNNGLCLHFCLEETCPPQFSPVILNNSVPPHMPQVPFNLLPQPWSSEGLSPSKSMQGHFKRNCLGLQKSFVSLSHNPCWFLQPEVMGTSLPGSRTLGWGAWFGVETPCSSEGTSAVGTPPDLYLPMGVAASLLCLPFSMWLL